MLKFTAEDYNHLETLEGKLTHVRDVVKGVAKNFHTGLILWGEGGTGKSYTVLEELQTVNAKYRYHNSRMTARGLVEALESSPHDIHFLEDAETLFDDRKAFGVLRSALWSQDKSRPMKREITWTAFKTDIRFHFYGGIIIISNSNLAEAIPEIRAIKTRINVLRIDISNDEIFALMKKICSKGFKYGDDCLSQDDCWEVAEYIIGELDALHRSLDIRLLINGFRDYLQWKAGASVLGWQDLLQGRMQQSIMSFKRRKEQKQDEAKIAAGIHAMKIPYEQKIRFWEEETGLKGERSFYRALNRLGS